MKEYLTKQRKLLLDYFASHAHSAVSAEELITEFSALGVISESAVYRNLDKLSEDGVIVRENDGRRNLYRYNHAHGCLGHLHLKCEMCGKTFHMDDGLSEELVKKVVTNNGFCIDLSTASLRGVCADCDKGVDQIVK